MRPIIRNIETLKQYRQILDPKGTCFFRPDQCPTCHKGDVICHGTYPRKADRLNTGPEFLSQIPICRFMCTHCNHTCSTLPECIPPRRWHLWIVQSAAWILLILKKTIRHISSILPPGRSTLRRWNNRFIEMFDNHRFHLCSRFPDLGEHSASLELFWHACLKRMTLSEAMYWIHHAGGSIP
jgi:hypothetical protein